MFRSSPSGDPSRRGSAAFSAEFIASDQARWVVLGLCLLVASTNLLSGFFSDDILFMAVLEGKLPSRPWFELYQFVGAGEAPPLVAQGALPWWTSPDLKVNLVRPLSSALFTLDHWLFGNNPLGYHLHSLVWLAAFLNAARVFFGRILPPATATLALLFLGLSQSLSTPVGWVSARHLLISGAPAALALVLLVAGPQSRRFRAAIPLLFLVSLLGGEAGLAGLAFWLSFAWLGPRPQTAQGAAMATPARAWHSWAPRLAPFGVLALYVVAYHWAEGGVAGSGTYLDPVKSPIAFAQASLIRVPILLSSAFLGIPAELAATGIGRSLCAIAWVGMVVIGLIYRSCRKSVSAQEKEALLWLLPAALVGTLAGAGGFPGSRIVLIPMLGFAPLLAVLLRHGLSSEVPDSGGRLWRRAGAVWLAIANWGGGLASHAVGIPSRNRMSHESDLAAQTMSRAAPGTERILILAASDPMLWMYTQAPLARLSQSPRFCASVVSTAKGAHRIRLQSPTLLDVDSQGAPMLAGLFENVFRLQKTAFEEGEKFTQCGVTYQLKKLVGGYPTRIEVDLGSPITEGKTALFVWREGKLEPLDPAGLVEGITVPWSPGPMGFL